MKNILLTFVCTTIFSFITGQMSCSFFGIGNRSYSLYCRSHFLCKKKFLLKFIYFKPKHFKRYSIFEVIQFFMSFVYVAYNVIMLLFFMNNIIYEKTFMVFTAFPLVLSFVLCFIWIIMNDITCYKEEKFFRNKEISWAAYSGNVSLYFDKNEKRVKSAGEKCIRFFKYYKFMRFERVDEEKTYAILYIKAENFEEKIKLNYV